MKTKILAIISALTILSISHNLYAVYQDKNENLPASKEERISNLFLDKTHQFKYERFERLKFWLGLNSSDGNNADKFETWISFLEKHWANPYFRPFDTVESAEVMLIEHPSKAFLIRLSTSEPGKLTRTFISDKEIVHQRLTLNQRGELIYNNKEYTFDNFILLKQPQSALTYINID